MVPQEIVDQLDKVILTGQNVKGHTGSAQAAEALDREKGILFSMILRHAEAEAGRVVDSYEEKWAEAQQKIDAAYKAGLDSGKGLKT